MRSPKEIIAKVSDVAKRAVESDRTGGMGDPIIGLWWCLGYPSIGKYIYDILFENDDNPSVAFDPIKCAEMCAFTAVSTEDTLLQVVLSHPIVPRSTYEIETILMVPACALREGEGTLPERIVPLFMTAECLLWVLERLESTTFTEHMLTKGGKISDVGDTVIQRVNTELSTVVSTYTRFHQENN